MIWVILIGTLILSISNNSLVRKRNTILWNDGICPNCKTNWELRSVCKDNSYTKKYYVCPCCHREITIEV